MLNVLYDRLYTMAAFIILNAKFHCTYLQDLSSAKTEGEPKIEKVLQLAEKVLPNTAPPGKEVVVKETDSLRADWDAFGMALTKVKCSI